MSSSSDLEARLVELGVAATRAKETAAGEQPAAPAPTEDAA